MCGVWCVWCVVCVCVLLVSTKILKMFTVLYERGDSISFCQTNV